MIDEVLEAPSAKKSNTFPLLTFLRKRENTVKGAVEAIAEFKKALANGTSDKGYPPVAIISSESQIHMALPIDFDGLRLSSIETSHTIPLLELSNFITWKFVKKDISNGNVSISNARIGHLILQPSEYCSLHLENCLIGSLDLAPDSVRNLTIKNCLILNISCPPPDEKNPISGTVEIDRSTYFDTLRGDRRTFSGPQCYTSMRAHLEKLQNARMAALFRSLELKAERQSDSGLNLIANWLYAVLANYGLSPAKPLLWALALYIICVAGIFALDGGATALPEDRYQGYLSHLFGDCAALVDTQFGPEICNERLARSAFLPFQSIGGPIVFFSANKLVVAKYFWTATTLVVQGLFTDILIFLTILSIRRRFKLT